jgi:hypothetical protein
VHSSGKVKKEIQRARGAKKTTNSFQGTLEKYRGDLFGFTRSWLS